MIIQTAQFESFEWRDGILNHVHAKFHLRCVIWIEQFKRQSGGVFQWRISQITQQNCRMNALTSKLLIWGAELRDLLTTSAYIPHTAYVQKHRKHKLRACLTGRILRHAPRHLLPLWNAKLQIQSLMWTLRNSNILQLLLSLCTLHNSNCAIQTIIQIAPFCSRVKNSHYFLQFCRRWILDSEKHPKKDLLSGKLQPDASHAQIDSGNWNQSLFHAMR